MNNTILENLTFHHDDMSHQQPLSFIIDLRFFLFRIFYPFLLIWGTIGNALCLRVLLSRKFNKNSTCQYLAILAVIDILFIVMRSSRHIYKLFRDSTIFNTSQWVCRILTFFSSALAHLASWTLVIVNFDRYFIVTSYYRRQGSTTNRVFWSTTTLIAIVALCNLYYFFILGRSIRLDGFGAQVQRRFLIRILSSTNETSLASLNNSINYSRSELLRYKPSYIFVCIPSTGFEGFFRTYIPIFDILLVVAIPFLLLCFTNIGIITFTMRSHRRMRQYRKRSHRRHQRLTIMLLSVTLAFIGLTCPSVIFICVNKIIYSGRIVIGRKDNLNENANLGPPSHVQLIVDVCEALWYTKHAMNFILYTLSGQSFRREFLKVFTPYLNCHSLLKKTDTTTTITQPTTDSQIHITSTRHKAFHRKSSRKNPINDALNISNAVFLH
ncbi:unnamed protein product [Adineta steineri]|uniref:G-protein coupled receptors family 1 profile domain-containing protein n=1 Tax=Adineta steineri TaxID=433720 RepID=A0A814G919_9BILA|nr:unnamed protein product [Adineta steineri]CAF4003785.1 unnamed protein product [Adineta steineri]